MENFMKRFLEFIYVWALGALLSIITANICNIDIEDKFIIITILVICNIVSAGLTRALFKYLNNFKSVKQIKE